MAKAIDNRSACSTAQKIYSRGNGYFAVSVSSDGSVVRNDANVSFTDGDGMTMMTL